MTTTHAPAKRVLFVDDEDALLDLYRIAFGTDTGVSEHGRNAEEFAQLVDLGGLTPAEAIASATTGAAKLLDLEGEVGRIAAGYSADIIAVDDDPLINIRTLEKVRFVMVRGRIIE